MLHAWEGIGFKTTGTKKNSEQVPILTKFGGKGTAFFLCAQ